MRQPEPGPVGSRWRTDTFRRLSTPMDRVVGAKTAKQLAALKINTVSDLMHHLPRRYLSGTELSDLSALTDGEEVAVLAEVVECRAFNMPEDKVPDDDETRRDRRPLRPPRKPRLEARVTDHRGLLTLTFFGHPRLIKFWQHQLLRGSRGIFAGKVKEFNGALQLAHPDFVLLDDDGGIVGGTKRNRVLASVSQTALIGLYPASAQLRTWTISETVGLALNLLKDVPEPLPDWIRAEVDVVGLETAFHQVHQPDTREESEQGRKRLRFDEAFGLQLTMAARRADAAAHGAIPRPRVTGGLLDAFDARLPFVLTAGQVEISDVLMVELTRAQPMQRLLQGEVGSGKTIVALRAMLAVIDAGGQAALLAPTEVLAGQHYQTITSMLGDLAVGGMLAADSHGTDVMLLTGSMSAARRRETLLRVASGDAGIVVGTHALLSAGVQFSDLGLVVVDEQHRFGVEQRAALSAKAAARPHVLVMTATPIPRSVAMTVFGDLEVSTLREIPAGRAEVSTVVVDAALKPQWVDRAWQRIIEEVAQGRQAFVVCARISATEPSPRSTPTKKNAEVGGKGFFGPEGEELMGDDDDVPAIAAEDLFAELAAGPLRSLRVELLHGQLPAEEKEQVMSRFAAAQSDVLVATTVVEVGVDVPNASVMVICDADRFGISQLHQLRGRIGRGGHPGICLLLTRAGSKTLARQRLEAVAATRDGFVLADIDLEQRREGDVLGASQSGRKSSLRLLQVLNDADVIAEARVVAERCAAEHPDDPGLADIVTQVELQAAGEWLERT